MRETVFKLIQNYRQKLYFPFVLIFSFSGTVSDLRAEVYVLKSNKETWTYIFSIDLCISGWDLQKLTNYLLHLKSIFFNRRGYTVYCFTIHLVMLLNPLYFYAVGTRGVGIVEMQGHVSDHFSPPNPQFKKDEAVQSLCTSSCLCA
jgi:hypothetical protein